MAGSTGAMPRVDAPVDYQVLFDQFSTPLRKLIFGFTRDWHATEDLLQETFLRVVRNLHRYRGQSSLKTWVTSIARNLCFDYLRSAGRTRLRLLETLDSSEHDRTLTRQAVPDSLCLDPGTRVEREERRVQVDRALSALTPKSRDFLVLRIQYGLSYREIAKRCGIRPAGVGTRISRALKSLSKKLG